jgi:uncharacterized protein (TIGR02118 family)
LALPNDFVHNSGEGGEGGDAAGKAVRRKTVIKVSVLYAYRPDVSFDMEYYLDRHIPMVRQKLGAACRGISVEQGVAGGAPGAPPTYAAMGHLLFDSVEAFSAAFAPHAAAIMADVANYSKIEPIVQISDVKLS